MRLLDLMIIAALIIIMMAMLEPRFQKLKMQVQHRENTYVVRCSTK
jgi:hypothetical protein